ncbi:MAG: hypothetical protein Q7I97_02650 [Thermovirgaceae bacterium]|nr:hypothetical protein [Thermovirgaceae bacterium]
MDKPGLKLLDVLLSQRERSALLLSAPLTRRLYGALIDEAQRCEKGWLVSSDWERLCAMTDALEKDIRCLSPGTDRDILAGVVEKLIQCIRDASQEKAAPKSDFPRRVDEALRGKDPKNLKEINETLHHISQAHNEQPIEEFGGLSPNQMKSLIYFGWWKKPESILLNRNLSPEELVKVPFFHNCRLLLGLVQEAGGVKTTTRGNLNREVVKQVFEKSIRPEGMFMSRFFQPRVLNEENVTTAHFPRIVCGLAGLLKKRKGHFEITRKAENLLKNENAGELYALLFGVYFRKFDISYCDGLPEVEMIQYTFPYSIYWLSKFEEDEFVKAEKAAASVLHPDSIRAIASFDNSFITPEFLFVVRILEHMEAFGLVEIRRDQESGIPVKPLSFRRTKLFDRFLTFDF